MSEKLKKIIEEDKLKTAHVDLWSFSLRAKEYASWLEQIYKELVLVQRNKLTKK